VDPFMNLEGFVRKTSEDFLA
jgi:ubiquinone/menaquinone biosynthesis C-methylase UbiE